MIAVTVASVASAIATIAAPAATPVITAGATAPVAVIAVGTTVPAMVIAVRPPVPAAIGATRAGMRPVGRDRRRLVIPWRRCVVTGSLGYDVITMVVGISRPVVAGIVVAVHGIDIGPIVASTSIRDTGGEQQTQYGKQ